MILISFGVKNNLHWFSKISVLNVKINSGELEKDS